MMNLVERRLEEVYVIDCFMIVSLRTCPHIKRTARVSHLSLGVGGVCHNSGHSGIGSDFCFCTKRKRNEVIFVAHI